MSGRDHGEALERRVARIEGLLQQIEASPDVEARGAAREVVTALLDFHGEGLARILDRLAKAGEPGRAILDSCAADDLLPSLFALHDLPRKGGELVQIRVPDKHAPAAAPEPANRCELCGAPVPEGHHHLLDPGARALACACDSCDRLDVSGRYLRVPSRVLALDDLRLSNAAWDALGVPVELAFFFRSAASGRVVALYPSPAGALESDVPREAWDALVSDNPILHEMLPDVEALLSHRLGGARDHFIVPIDRCFELSGLMRAHGRSIMGFGRGGDEGEIQRFFTGLRADAARPAAR